MKVTWEAHDVVCGRLVARGKTVERWKIGYDPTTDRTDGEELRHPLILISMNDGMISHRFNTKKEMAEQLNKSEMVPMELWDSPFYRKEDERD